MSKEKKEMLLGLVALFTVVAVLGVAAYLMRQLPAQPTLPNDPGLSATDPFQSGSQSPEIPTEPKPTLVPNPFDAEDFVWCDGFMQLVDGETITGIDVSYHQKQIDWQQVKDAGVQFVIVRLGYRGYESGLLVEDNMAMKNLQAARDVGLLVGAYFYSQAINAEEAAEEALFAMEILNGFQLDLPIAYDWEYVSETARTANVDGETMTACTIAFCDTILAGGYETMVYFNPQMAEHKLDMIALQEKEYPFWLAHFSEVMTFQHKIWIWQYSYTGKIPGISGTVDLNIMLPHG